MRGKLYLATIGADAPALAREHGLGLELDEFCTAANFDENFGEWDGRARAALRMADRLCSTRRLRRCRPARSTR